MTAYTSDAAVDRIIAFVRGPVFSGIVRTFADRKVEDISAMDAVMDAFDLDTSVGVQLDRLGEILQRPRQGEDDDRYRLILRMQIQLILSSTATTDVLLEVVSEYTGSEAPTYREPASVAGRTYAEMEIGASVEPDDHAPLVAFLRVAKGAGIRLDVVLQETDSDAVLITDYEPDDPYVGATDVDYHPGDPHGDAGTTAHVVRL